MSPFPINLTSHPRMLHLLLLLLLPLLILLLLVLLEAWIVGVERALDLGEFPRLLRCALMIISVASQLIFAAHHDCSPITIIGCLLDYKDQKNGKTVAATDAIQTDQCRLRYRRAGSDPSQRLPRQLRGFNAYKSCFGETESGFAR